ETKARAVLQLCASADQLRQIQGILPRRFHVAGGGPEPLPLPLWTADYDAYFRSVRARMQAFVERRSARSGGEPYPEPVEHCAVCRYWKRCEDRRRADDHLSLVAGITRRQRDRLGLTGVKQLLQLARLGESAEVPGIATEPLARIRQQAALQLRGRTEGRALYELLTGQPPGVGLEALPRPTPGDLFLDLEGDSFALDGGLEYLFGLVDFGEPELDFTLREAPGPARYRAFWAANRAEEKRAFEAVIDRVLLGRQEFPDLHLFHFGHREADALKKLSCRHATREAEVDQLLRDGVLVDLLPIVRHGLRASVESYSLKQLEVLHGFQRATELRPAARAMQLFGWWLETGDELLPLLELRATIQSYNRDDCLSTAQLRDFLEGRRADLAQLLGRPVARPLREPSSASEELSERQRATAELGRRLTDDASHAQAPQRRLLADLLDFHWREAKSGWWEHYRALELAPPDRLEDRSAIAELSYAGVVGRVKQSAIHRYTFPEQEHGLRLVPAPIDPDTKRSSGEVLDIRARHLDIRRGPRLAVPHPRALVVGTPIKSTVLAQSLLAFAEQLLAGGPGYEAARALLFRSPPLAGSGAPLLRDGELPEQALGRLSSELTGSVLAVQGPPGSGKTHQAALMILGLLGQGKRVGVTANSHAVVKHLLERVCQEAERQGRSEQVQALHLEEDPDPRSWPFRIDDNKQRARQELEQGSVNLLGGTAWTWAREDYGSSVDVLVIDEAGQLSLANALAVARAGRGLVLFGDPAQLEQPQKGVHPDGAEVSTLEHWLGGDALTIPPELGVFLPRTRRLHPSICDFVSQTFYEGRLSPEQGLGLERQALRLPGGEWQSGARFVPTSHRGNTNQSEEEVEAVVRWVQSLLDPATRFRSRSGELRALTAQDVLVIAPYNAQVALLRRALDDEELRVGTVDKFQGQEAPVVIYSMTSSSAEDAPRGLEFLFSLNRLNVAVSRAQALCLVVASPELPSAACQTPRQVKLVNALCAFLERSGA
ncbi:MAG TPA: TM0106 family RecB-like putative nuclease, partial [Polyangiaceae bacterium]